MTDALLQARGRITGARHIKAGLNLLYFHAYFTLLQLIISDQFFYQHSKMAAT